MNGKILKISSNDLYGNVDDREVAVFAVFNHLKYMNKYIIFAFTDEYNKNKLYYGSVHMKTNSVVTFKVDDNNPYVNSFIESYLNNNIDKSEYEIMDLSNINKIELVSYNEIESNKIYELDKISIYRKPENKESNEVNKKPIFLYTILVLMVVLLIGVTYLYFNPGLLEKEYKELTCNIESYDNKINLKYNKSLIVKFNESDKLKEINVIDTYKFKSKDSYLDFKNNNKELVYFNIIGEYKYNDVLYELKLFYNDKLILEDYDEVYNYYKKEGYSCLEGTYNE